MKKTLLAVAIPALMYTGGVSAVELYNDGANKVSLGGHASVSLTKTEEGDLEVTENSPRINFGFDRDLGNGYKLDAKVEWGFNLVDDSDHVFYNRLGYMGLSHDDYGHVRVGKQWGVFYDAVAPTDMPIAFATDYAYFKHGDLGTARANKAVTYRNAFDLNGYGNLAFGLQWQGSNDETDDAGMGYDYDDRFAGSLGYRIAGFGLNYAYSGGDITVDGEEVDANSHLVSAVYGTYGAEGIYAAVGYNMGEYMHDNAGIGQGVGALLEESIAYEAILAYGMANGLNFILNHETVEDDKQSKDVMSTSAFQVEYTVNPGLVVFTGYQYDHGNDFNNDDDSAYTVGARIYF